MLPFLFESLLVVFWRFLRPRDESILADVVAIGRPIRGHSDIVPVRPFDVVVWNYLQRFANQPKVQIGRWAFLAGYVRLVFGPCEVSGWVWFGVVNADQPRPERHGGLVVEEAG